MRVSVSKLHCLHSIRLSHSVNVSIYLSMYVYMPVNGKRGVSLLCSDAFNRSLLFLFVYLMIFLHTQLSVSFFFSESLLAFFRQTFETMICKQRQQQQTESVIASSAP